MGIQSTINTTLGIAAAGKVAKDKLAPTASTPPILSSPYALYPALYDNNFQSYAQQAVEARKLSIKAAKENSQVRLLNKKDLSKLVGGASNGKK